MLVPNRHASTPVYRYGFGGHEKIDEIKGEGNHLDFGDFGYDPRIGRRFDVDPKFKEIAGISPYSYALNNPNVYIDEDGQLPILPLLLKAGAAGAADMLTQAAMNYYFEPGVKTIGQAFDKVNWWQVGRSSAEGLIPWKTPGGKFGKAAATAMGDVMINALDQGSNYSKEEALKDFAVGFIGDLAGGGLGELTAKYGSKGVAKGLSKMGFSYGDVNRMLGGGVKKINKTVNGITATRKMVGWAEGKVAVIGRGQTNRVNVFADGLKAETWKGFDENLSKAENLANNKAWIQGLKDEGYTIYDVGTGPKSSNKGEHYGMETEEVFGN